MRLRPSFIPVLVVVTFFLLAQDTPQRVQVSEEIMRGFLVKTVDPTYPAAHVQGVVALKAGISKTGDVQYLQVISGHPMLVPAAINAVSKWKYRPYLLNGGPVEVATTIRLNFVFSQKPAAEGATSDAQSEYSAVVMEQASPTRVSEAVMRKLRTKKIDPVYPAEGVQSGFEGTVILSVRISKTGDVTDVQVISNRQRAPFPVLPPAAIEAVKEWKYNPYRVNGEPIEVVTVVHFDCELSEENPPKIIIDEGTPMGDFPEK